MNIIIIEDETRAANRIKRLISEIDPTIDIVQTIESVALAIDYLKQNQPDLIISDIQLADGLSFEIYKSVSPTCPIIFTTAYDQYAIQAFETNGVDYLLKPIESDRLAKALDKVQKLKPQIDLEKLLNLSLNRPTERQFKSRFMIKVGDKIKAIPIEDVRLFYSMEKGTYLNTINNRNYVLEYPLEQISEMLNPQNYFKISRKYIVHIDAAKEIIAHSNSRLKLKIDGFETESIIVAREKVAAFKAWLDQ
ncbi:MAG: DNA-binding LytR/AlgR family response regulator [Crocinitomix sp.]|jgi:DNA-binding LytR/AlgR family response regulator